jgi:15-cis-phytoene synthase
MSDAVIASSEESIRKGSKSFAAAARIFDRSTRDDCVMLYAWCRHCDDVIDGQTLGHEQQADFRQGQAERLELLRQETARALGGGDTPSDPVFAALKRVAERRSIPELYPQQLLDGFAMDVEGRRYETVADTLDYGYHVAGVVGVMMAQIMGVREPSVLDRASDLGIAFQLTNIARDVIEDARAGRVYLPADLLREQGVEAVDAENMGQRPGLYRAALRLLEIADVYYDSALVGMRALPPRSALAIAAARRVYRAIGEKLRKGGPQAWDGRVSTTSAEKVGLFGRAVVDVAGSWAIEAGKYPRVGLYQRPV